MKSKTVERLLEKMKKDPWYIKLKRWIKIQIWVYVCLNRKYWDKDFSGYIFKKNNYDSFKTKIKRIWYM